MPTLRDAKKNERFELPSLGLRGVCLSVNDCSAHVVYSDGKDTRITPSVPCVFPDRAEPPNYLYGHPVGAMVRYCGSMGWTLDEVTTLLTHLGKRYYTPSLPKWIKAGRRMQDVPTITKEQANTLERIVDNV